MFVFVFFFFQAEDGIRDLVRSRGLGDVYKRQLPDAFGHTAALFGKMRPDQNRHQLFIGEIDRHDRRSPTAFTAAAVASTCLLYTSDAADERSSVDLGGRRIIKKKKNKTHTSICARLKQRLINDP